MALSRIVVRLPNWLGDLLMSRPAFHALRVAHPTAELRAVTTPALAGLAGWDAGWSAIDAWPRAGEDRAALARDLKRWRPDAALILPPSFSSAWWMRQSGARVRIGYRGEGRRWLLTRAPSRPARGSLHLAAEYLGLVPLLSDPGRQEGMGDPTMDLVRWSAGLAALRVSADANTRADAVLARRGVSGGFAVIGPGALYGPAKRWSPERFAEVGRGLTHQGLRVLVCGVRAELSACLEVARRIEGAQSLAGETDLEVQAALCARAALVVSNDSGLGHLAAATGTRTVAVFGSTSSAWTAPIGPRVRVVQRAPVCSPCFQRTCRIGYPCLSAVDSGSVLRACRELLAA